MARNKHANGGQKRRKVRLTVALGDPGKPRPNKIIEPIHPLQTPDDLTTREMVSMLISAGAPLTEIFGIDHCYEHFRFKPVVDNLPPSTNPGFDLAYCKNCWQWYRQSSSRASREAQFEADLGALQLKALRKESGG